MANQKNTSIGIGVFMEKENKEETLKNEEEKQEELADLTEELKEEAV